MKDNMDSDSELSKEFEKMKVSEGREKSEKKDERRRGASVKVKDSGRRSTGQVSCAEEGKSSAGGAGLGMPRKEVRAGRPRPRAVSTPPRMIAVQTITLAKRKEEAKALSFGKSKMLKDWGKCTEGPYETKAEGKLTEGTKEEAEDQDRKKVGGSQPTIYECEEIAPLKLKMKRQQK